MNSDRRQTTGTRTSHTARRRGLEAVVGALITLGLLASGVTPAAAAATRLQPVRPASASFLDTQTAIRSSDVEVDAAGATHVAFDRWNSNTFQSAAYAYCPPGAVCTNPSHWAQVNLVPSVELVMAPAQLKLTPAGQPRILFTVGRSVVESWGGTTTTTSFRYAACDSACTNVASWTVLDLASVFNKPGQIGDENGSGAHFFALDPQGRPRFVYSFQDADGVGRLHYASCDSGCATSVANWTKTTVSQGTGEVGTPDSITYYSLSLDFTAGGQPRVAGYSNELKIFTPGAENIAYLECNSGCTAPEPESAPNPNWSVTAVMDKHGYGLVMRLDNADAPHIMAGGAGDLDSDLHWLWCASACSAPSSWSSAPVGTTGRDPDLVFDGDNRPHVVFHGPGSTTGPDSVAYAWCTSACDTASAPWKFQEMDDNRAFQAELPLLGSPCDPGTWLVGYRPSLALDPAGNPRVGYSGEHVYNTCNFNMVTNGINVRIARYNFYPRPADFDGNVTTDVSVFRPSNGYWFVQNGATVQFGTTGDVAVPADYDGNGSIDIAVFRPSNGFWFVHNGPIVQYGAAGDIPVPGDYDGDGKADMGVFRPSNGVWFVKFSSGGDGSVQFGTNGDIPVTGDYDGDHLTDVAVYRPSSGTWFLGGSSLPDRVVGWGTAGDVPVPGDYDSDGDTDVAVYRPANGFWFVHGGAVSQFGTSGDVPSPGDYNADGRTDIAVFRPANGYWFVQGGPITQFGTSGDAPLPLPDAIRRFFPAP